MSYADAYESNSREAAISQSQRGHLERRAVCAPALRMRNRSYKSQRLTERIRGLRKTMPQVTFEQFHV
jgi:hypothetical protein